jgi:hypothetical protein
VNLVDEQNGARVALKLLDDLLEPLLEIGRASCRERV